MRPRRGELGYREHQVEILEAGRCGCPGCSGTLTDPDKSPGGWRFCQVCGCAWKVQDLSGTRYAANVANVDRCPDAKAQLAERNRQRERDARQRALAEQEAGETWEAGR